MSWYKKLKSRIRFSEPLKKHIVFKVGGAAEVFFEPKDLKELKACLRAVNEEGIPCRVIGRGSNILASDSGLGGLVLKLSSPVFCGLKLRGSTIYAGAGVGLNKLVAFSKECSLSSLEFLAGIPGTVGGALAGNSGAWGRSIAEQVESVTVADLKGNQKKLIKEKIKFGYRSSGLDKYIIIGAVFKLIRKDKAEISSRIREYLAMRLAKQDFSRPSLGSTFRNPQGHAAGELIDLCGLKGHRIGGAAISTKHANFILNLDNASSKDVLRLMDLAREKVKSKFNINLEPEIKIWQ